MPSHEAPEAAPSEALPQRGSGAPPVTLVVAIVALVVALAAAGLSAWTAFGPDSTKTDDVAYTDTQRADAKIAICAAVEQVRTGISVNTNLPIPGGEGDLTGALAVQANARQSLSGGGQYLLNRVDPATSADLADTVKRFANSLLDIGAAATSGITNTDPAQAARLKDAEGTSSRLTELCK